MRVDRWCYGLASPFSKEICRKQLRMVFYHRASVHLLDCYSPCFLVYYSIIEILIPNEYAETRTCATTRLCLRPSLLYFVMQMPLAWLSYLLANHFSFHQMVYFHFQGKALWTPARFLHMEWMQYKICLGTLKRFKRNRLDAFFTRGEKGPSSKLNLMRAQVDHKVAAKFLSKNDLLFRRWHRR